MNKAKKRKGAPVLIIALTVIIAMTLIGLLIQCTRREAPSEIPRIEFTEEGDIIF